MKPTMYFDSENTLGSKTTSPLSLPLEQQAMRVTLWQPPCNMPALHWHGHIELNIPFDDDVEYVYNGMPITIKANHIAIFWASVPHRLSGRCQPMSNGISKPPWRPRMSPTSRACSWIERVRSYRSRNRPISVPRSGFRPLARSF